MKDSIILNFIEFIAKKIFEIYNDSFIEKIIKSICGFFKKRSANSFICGLFKNNFLNGAYWRESVVFKIVTFPIRLIMKISAKCSVRLTELRKNSSIVGILDNLADIPVREYGILLLSFTVGALISQVVLGQPSRSNIICGILLLAAAGIMSALKCNARQLYLSSKVLKLFGGIFNEYSVSYEKKTEGFHIKPIKLLAAVLFVLGLCLGYDSCIIALGAVLAALGMALILTNTMFGIFLTVFAAPIMPTMVCVGIILITAVSFVIKMITNKEKYVITPMSGLIVMFLGIIIFSAVTSFNFEKSIQTLAIYIIFAVPYFLIINTIKTKNQWYNLIVTFILAGFFVALFGLYQNFFMAATDTSWIDEEMFEEIGVRVYSTFENPNVLGQFLVLATPLAFAAMWSVKKMSSKILFLVMTSVMGGCLVLTWSRAAWVGIVLAIGFFLLMKDRRWSSLCILALLILPFVLPENIISRITSIGNMKDSSTAYRVSIWVAALKMAKDYWLSGIGLGMGAFERVYQNYALNGAGFALHSHNFYLELIVEFGVMGLLLFMLIIFSAFKQIVSIKDKNSINKNIAIAIGGALIGYLFQGVAEFLWYNYRMILIFWICLAILQKGAALSQSEPLPEIGIKE